MKTQESKTSRAEVPQNVRFDWPELNGAGANELSLETVMKRPVPLHIFSRIGPAVFDEPMWHGRIVVLAMR